jgi:hypothetical protein
MISRLLDILIPARCYRRTVRDRLARYCAPLLDSK